MRYREALNLALREEMTADEKVFLMGEDIGVFQGAFKVTAGLMEEFGVVVLPGSAFGPAGEGYFRIALTVSPARLTEAIGRIGRALEADRGAGVAATV